MLDNDILAYESVTEIVNSFEINDNLLFLRAGQFPDSRDLGRSVGWDVIQVQRDVEAFEGNYSKSSPRALQAISNQRANLIRSSKSTLIIGNTLVDLRSPGSVTRQQVAEERLAMELRSLRGVIERQNEFLQVKAMTGEIPVTIDGIAHTIDFGFPSSHTFENGNLAAPIAVSWGSPGADIVGDLTRIKKVVARDSGRMLRRAYCQSDVMAAIAKNDQFLAQIGQTLATVGMIQTGTLSPFWGLEWIAYDGTYVDVNGDPQYLIPDGTILFGPSPDREVAFNAIGSEVISAGEGRMQEVVDLVAYSYPIQDPVGVTLVVSQTRLPIIRLTNAFATAKVIF